MTNEDKCPHCGSRPDGKRPQWVCFTKKAAPEFRAYNCLSFCLRNAERDIARQAERIKALEALCREFSVRLDHVTDERQRVTNQDKLKALGLHYSQPHD